MTTIAEQAWADLGGDPTALARLAAPDPAVALAGPLDAGGLLGDCVALAQLAAAEVGASRRGSAMPDVVRVDGARVTTASQSERHFRLDGEPPEVWAPLSGFWKAADGWVRTHGNYPHHAERLARMLGLGPAPTKQQAAAALAHRSATELEDEAVQAGAVLGAVRTPEDWARHEQAIAVAELPLVERVVEHGALSRPWEGTGAEAPAARPLDGVRVLDLTRVLAGPVATRNLAFLGADVLRVDAPQLPETGWIHLDTGAGKRSTTLDLRAPADQAVLEDLLRSADVVVTGYRPGGLDSLGLSPQAIAERVPGVVAASVSAWSTHGPWGGRRGFDSIVQAVTGIAVSTGDGDRPGALPAQALDHSAGHLLTAAICRALRAQREQGGTHRVAVALVTLARELLRTTGTAVADPSPPTLQTARTAAGVVTCAAPPMTGPGLPDAYPALASPWGTDEPRWREG